MKSSRTSARLALFVAAVILAPRSFASESSNLTELASGWRMTSAKSVTGNDAAISEPGYDASR